MSMLLAVCLARTAATLQLLLLPATAAAAGAAVWPHSLYNTCCIAQADQLHAMLHAVQQSTSGMMCATAATAAATAAAPAARAAAGA
jgi:hypothetical protein